MINQCGAMDLNTTVWVSPWELHRGHLIHGRKGQCVFPNREWFVVRLGAYHDLKLHHMLAIQSAIQGCRGCKSRTFGLETGFAVSEILQGIVRG